MVHKDKNKWNSLHSAARDGDVTKIKALLSHGFFINSRTSVGKTPLMIAAENDKIQAIHYFLQNGADPSLKDNEGWNLLHCASQGGNPVIIELVVGHVPSIDSENNRGITPLMAAARLGKVQAVKFLLEKGASPSLEDNSGWNSLHWASWGGNTAVIEKILFCGVDIESKGKEGSTPRMIAQRHGQAEASTYLSKFAKHFKKDK